MLSGGDCREGPSLSASCPRQNHVGTISIMEANPAPWCHGQQTLLSNHCFYTDLTSKEDTSRKHLSKCPNYSVNVGDKALNHPLLLQLLTDDNNNNSNHTFLLSQQLKTTPQPTTVTSLGPSISMIMPRENKNLDDDQILELIEQKLVYFRAQMAALKRDSSSKNSSNPTTGTSRALDDNVSKDHRGKASGRSKHIPEKSSVTDNGTAGTLPSSNSPLLFDKNLQYVTSTDCCIGDNCTYSEDNGSPLNCFSMDTRTTDYPLTALKEMIISLEHVKTPHKKTFIDNILQKSWDGKMDNVHLFTSTEYVPIMQDAAAITSKKVKDRDAPRKVPNTSETVQDVTKCRSSLPLHHTLANQKNNSSSRNVHQSVSLDKQGSLHPVVNTVKAADNLPIVVNFSNPSHSTPTAPALETAERQSCHSREKLPQSSNNSENVEIHLSHDRLVKEHEPQQSIEVQEKKDETKDYKMERGLFERMNEILKNPMYDDISDEETNRTQSISIPSLSLQNKDSLENLPVQSSRQLANATPAENFSVPRLPQVSLQVKISSYEGPVSIHGETQVEGSLLPKQNVLLKGNLYVESKTDYPKPCSPSLQCSCPFFVETEDGFEQRPCPKCTLDGSSSKEDKDPSPNLEEDLSQTMNSGSDYCLDTELAAVSQHKTVTDPLDEEDEWLVVPLEILDVKFEEIIVLDDTDDEESENPLSHEPLNQPSQSIFQKLPEFDSLPSFLQSKMVQFQCEVPLEVTETAPSLQLPLGCSSSLKLEAIEKVAAEPTSTPPMDVDDSCDTDDSLDYPVQTKQNYLTASTHVEAPSPPCHVSESVEEGEVPQSPSTMQPRSPFSKPDNIFSHFLPSEDLNTLNDATSASTLTRKLSKDGTETEGKKSKSKTLKGVPLSDDADGALNENCKLKRKTRGTSQMSKDSSPKQPVPRPGSIQARFEQNNPVSSVSSKASCHMNKAVKRSSSSKNSSSNHVKVGRSCPEAAGSMVQEMPEKHQSVQKSPQLEESSASDIPKCNANTHNTKTNASNTTNQNIARRQPLQSSMPTKAKDVCRSSLTKTLTLNGDKYQASSLPGLKRSQSESQSFSPPKPNQVNSYSTAMSTQAKKRVVEQWESQHVPVQVKTKRRSSIEQSASSHNDMVNMANRRDLENSAQKKRISRMTPLRKKTLSDAKQLTQQTHRQASTEQNPDNRFIAKGYKWKETLTNDLDWERERDRRSPGCPKGLFEY